MKTIPDLKNRIGRLQIKYSQYPKESNTYNDRIVFLRTCILFLENKPSKEWLELEKNRVAKMIEKTSYSDDRSELPIYQTQLHTLRFILR